MGVMEDLRLRMRRLFMRLRLRLERDRLEQELAEELAFHEQRKAEEHMARGVDRPEAQRLARRQMGNTALSREECWEMWGFLHLERLWADVRHAVRMYARTPLFAATCIVSIAVGIGGNAAMFSLVNALLVKPLPYRHPDRLVRITGIYPRAAVPFFQSRSRTMEIASVSAGTEMTIRGDGPAARAVGSYATSNFLDVLGTQVALGRSFERGEDLPGKDGVIILSDALWKERFGGDRAVLGRVVLLDGVNRRIIGVMGSGFAYPSTRTQFWIPMRMDSSNFLEYWGAEFMPLVARLRPGANLSEAQGEVRSLSGEFRGTFPYPMRRDFNADSTAIPLQRDVVGDMRERLLILLASVAAVLLIACANVSGMLLSRATARRREIALRAALGAGSWRVVRQMLTESTLLATAGAAMGVFLAAHVLSFFKLVLPATMPGVAEAGIDWQVIAAASAMALFTGIAAGLAPALRASRPDLLQSIRTGSQRSASPLWTCLRNSIIAAQVAMTLVLLISAGLLLKSVYLLSVSGKGFDATRVVTIRVSPDRDACMSREACVAFYGRLIEEARAVAGVLDAAAANSVPLDGRVPSLPVDIEGRAKTVDSPAPLLWFGAVTPGYFAMAKIPLLAGRYLSDADANAAEPVAVVSVSTAKRFWPTGNAVGQHLRPAGGTHWYRVVGVVGDVHHLRLGQGLPSGFDGTVYMPYAQSVGTGGQFPRAMTLVAKLAVDDSAPARAIREMIRARNPNVPVGRVETLEAMVAESTAGIRSTMMIFSGFAAVAILLAATGIYGLMAYWVGQRRYEIGLRMAIGSSRWRILSMVLGQALRLVAAGVAVGIGLALALTGFLSTQLYGVGSVDVATVAAAALLLFVTAGSATVLPAWRAMQIDPAIALRAD